MDSDESDPDIVIVVGNNLRIRTECNEQSSDEGILRLMI